MQSSKLMNDTPINQAKKRGLYDADIISDDIPNESTEFRPSMAMSSYSPSIAVKFKSLKSSKVNDKN